jgi:hypothetical protein
MTRETLHLPEPGRRKMTTEEWEINVDCDLKKRDHKWRWKLDISTGLPSMDHGICVHCGREAIMKESGIKVLPREET